MKHVKDEKAKEGTHRSPKTALSEGTLPNLGPQKWQMDLQSRLSSVIFL